jgi:hypothetical protein
LKVYLAFNESHKKFLSEANARIMFTYPGIDKAMPSWDLLPCRDIMIDSGGYQLDV